MRQSVHLLTTIGTVPQTYRFVWTGCFQVNWLKIEPWCHGYVSANTCKPYAEFRVNSANTTGVSLQICNACMKGGGGGGVHTMRCRGVKPIASTTHHTHTHTLHGGECDKVLMTSKAPSYQGKRVLRVYSITGLPSVSTCQLDILPIYPSMLSDVTAFWFTSAFGAFWHGCAELNFGIPWNKGRAAILDHDQNAHCISQ